MPLTRVYLPRILKRFESIDGTYSWDFPLIGYEREVSQDLLVPAEPIIGVDYGFDMLGNSQAIKTFGEERIRFSLHSKCSPAELDSELETMTRNLFKAGKGIGWTINSAGEKQWAEMRMISMPTYTIQGIDEPRAARLIDVVAVFRIQSPYFLEDGIFHIETITASPTTFNVTNPGRDTAKRMTIRFRANTSANFTGGLLENLTTGKEFEFTTVMNDAAKEIMLDTRAPRILYSSNDAVAYSDAWSEYTLPPATQRILSFDFDPEVNSLRFTSTGTIRVNIEIEADAPA